MHLPGELADSPQDLEALLASDGTGLAVGEQLDSSEQDSTLYAFEHRSRSYVAHLEFGSAARCVEAAAQTQARLLPFLVLGLSNSECLEPVSFDDPRALDGRRGFAISGRSRVPESLGGEIESVGWLLRRPHFAGEEDAESVSDLGELPWRDIAGVLTNPERHIDRVVQLAAAMFHRALRSRDLEARLLLLTVAAEVLLVGESNESKLDQIVRRMGLLAYLQTAEARAESRRVADTAIKLRNAVVHEGRALTRADEEPIVRFQLSLMHLLFGLLGARAKYPAKETLFRRLDERDTRRSG